MLKNIVKRIGLATTALAFSLLSVSNVGAAEYFGAAVEKNGNLAAEAEDELQDDGRTYCDAGAASMFASRCDNIESQPLNSESNELSWTGVSTITMHVNEDDGYFEGEANPSEHSKDFYFRDGFDDYTKPISRRNNYVFAGWSFSESATTVDVEVGVTKAGQIDGDLYAVWSNKSYVFYHMINSYWVDPDQGDAYQDVVMEYDAGSVFVDLGADGPTPNENIYDFVGWYERMGGKGKEYIIGETVIDTLITDVYTAWNYNASRIENEMILDEIYDVTVGVSIPVFKFTAPETAMYEIYTDGIESGDTPEELNQGMIRVEDIFDRTLAMEEQMDYPDGWGDVHTYYEMQEGETYYIRFLEAGGHFLQFQVSIRKPEMVDVTFHANHDSAYFDGDTEKDTKIVALPAGKNIRYMRMEELTYDSSEMSFGSWRLENDEDRAYLLVSSETPDVYASYVDMVSVILDYNGGYDPIDKTSTGMVAKFIPGTSFETPIDPDIADPELDFVGWSRDQDATVPDADIVEDNISADLLKNETLYAIYGERAPVTFVTEYGAYMLDDPNTTVFESSNAIGHIFYGMSVMHRDLNVVHTGWTDQDGARTYQTDGIDPRYKIQGDTTFTAVLEYRLIAHANGGVFPNGGIGGAEELIVQFPYIGDDTMFSFDKTIERTGVPESYNSLKYFVGFARRDDATEADIDDETRAAYLDGEFFAVWADDSYYVAEGENATWSKGSENGARFVVKREGNDEMTYRAFSGIYMDGEEVSEDNFTDERGSLVLTLDPDYLNNLETGEHELTIRFLDSDSQTGEEFETNVRASLTIAEGGAEDEDEEEFVPIPNTGANTFDGFDYAASATCFAIIGTVVVILVGLFVVLKTKN